MEFNFDTTGLNTVDGKVDAQGYKVKSVSILTPDQTGQVDNVVYSLRKQVYEKTGQQNNQREPKAKYRKLTNEQKAITTQKYKDDLLQNNNTALQIQAQKQFGGLINSFRQAYLYMNPEKLGGMKDTLYVLTRQPDKNTGAFQILSKKNAAQTLGFDKLITLSDQNPRLYAALRVALSWNRFVRSASNYLKWANHESAMKKRRDQKKAIAQAGTPYKLLQLIQRKKSKLNLTGQSLQQMAQTIYDAREEGKRKFQRRQEEANTSLQNMVQTTGQIQGGAAMDEESKVAQFNPNLQQQYLRQMKSGIQTQQRRKKLQNGLTYQPELFALIKSGEQSWSQTQDFYNFVQNIVNQQIEMPDRRANAPWFDFINDIISNNIFN